MNDLLEFTVWNEGGSNSHLKTENRELEWPLSVKLKEQALLVFCFPFFCRIRMKKKIIWWVNLNFLKMLEIKTLIYLWPNIILKGCKNQRIAQRLGSERNKTQKIISMTVKIFSYWNKVDRENSFYLWFSLHRGNILKGKLQKLCVTVWSIHR